MAPESNASVFVVVPAYNEAGVIKQTLLPLLKAGYTVAVVDDGSTDQTAAVVSELPVILLRHPVNLGAGAAIQTGITFAASKSAKWIVLFDADGQHRHEDIPVLLEPLYKNQADMVIGSRFLQKDDTRAVPLVKQIILRIGVLVNGILTGMWLTDAHNGLRAMTLEAAKKIDLKENGYAHCSELLIQVRRFKLRCIEKPTKVLYTQYSMAKGQSIWNGINIVVDLILRRFFQ